MQGNVTTQAYNRATYFDKRCELMQEWADYVLSRIARAHIPELIRTAELLAVRFFCPFEHVVSISLDIVLSQLFVLPIIQVCRRGNRT